MFLFTKLPTRLFVIIILAIGAIGLIGWRGILVFEDIRQISNDITELSQDIHKAEKTTADWKTYRNEEYGYEIKFPSDLVLQKNTGEAYTSFLGKLSGEDYFLEFGYISQNTLNTIGISYCGAHPNDSRCENFAFNSLNFLIDWNIKTEGAFTQSRAEILKPGGGMIIINILHSPSQDIKLFFRQILSTFKFVK